MQERIRLRLGADLLADMLPLSSPQVLATAFSPDGRIIATGDGEGTLRLWAAPERPYHPLPANAHDAHAGESATERRRSGALPVLHDMSLALLEGHRDEVRLEKMRIRTPLRQPFNARAHIPRRMEPAPTLSAVAQLGQ